MTTAPGPQMNVTPMIDILLVLIIVFMVLQQHSSGLDTKVPQPSSAEQPSAEVQQNVVLTVEGAGRVKVNQDSSIAVGDLQERLKSIFKTAAKPVLFVRGGRELAFQEIAEVIDLAKGVGFTRIALMNE